MYPTPKAALVTAAFSPLALLIGVFLPTWWELGLIWGAGIFGMVWLDILLAVRPENVKISLSAPAEAYVGGYTSPLVARADFRRCAKAPRRLDGALALEGGVRTAQDHTSSAVEEGICELSFPLTAVRRGAARVERLSLRWTGPLGLAWRQVDLANDAKIAVNPNLPAIRSAALELFSREAAIGAKLDLDPGQGSELHGLQDFQAGMDRRSIDWKQSAKAQKLLSREYEVERNHPVMLVVDSGRLMCEPVNGAARLDHAINSALLLAFISLKLGDRAGLYSFDARPKAYFPPTANLTSFPAIQRLAANLSYSPEETNFTLGLHHLNAQLKRRSLVVVFSDFSDSSGAELMLEGVEKLTRRHRLVFVALKDKDLVSRIESEPENADDVVKAVVAGELMQGRRVVLERLKRLGVDVIETPPNAMSARLIALYLRLKKTERL